MKRPTRHSITLLIISLAAGCLGVPRDETLDAMVGQDVEFAIETMGQPDEVIELGEGRRSYVWQRIFTYDYGPPSFTLEQWRYDDTMGFEDEFPEAPARLCSTSLAVNFDFLIESWGYECETILVERQQWPAEQDRPNRVFIPGRTR